MTGLIANHLWQSTIFGGLTALAVLALRRNRAAVRYRLWQIASLKFLVPFALLTAGGSRLSWRVAGAASPTLTSVIEIASAPFAQPAVRTAASSAGTLLTSVVPAALVAVWAAGFGVTLLTWAIRWRRMTHVIRSAPTLEGGREVERLRALEHAAGVTYRLRLVVADSLFEPGVFGVLRPVLVWPRTLSDHLSDTQIDAVLVHELAHVRRRDNLAAAVHMFVEAVYWFHPMVWWIGGRLLDERERACDADVVEQGSDAETYADSILTICRCYLESPLACIAGVTGEDLKRRIEGIMQNDPGTALAAPRKLMLAAAAVAIIAGPVGFGVLTSGRVSAQAADTLGPPFARVSVTSHDPADDKAYPFEMEGDRFIVRNVRLRNLIFNAYQLRPPQLVGGPGWVNAERVDIDARTTPGATNAEKWAMVRRLLADEFKLRLTREIRQVPQYALVFARADRTLGPQLRESLCTGKDTTPLGPTSPAQRPEIRCGMAKGSPNGMMAARFVTMDDWAIGGLGPMLGRLVQNETGLAGHFDLDVMWPPDSRPPGPQAAGVGPATLTAIEEQLGLKVEERTGNVDVFVIEDIQRRRMQN